MVGDVELLTGVGALSSVPENSASNVVKLLPVEVRFELSLYNSRVYPERS